MNIAMLFVASPPSNSPSLGGGGGRLSPSFAERGGRLSPSFAGRGGRGGEAYRFSTFFPLMITMPW